MLSDMDAKGRELDALYQALNSAADQFFVRTATWGLERWEMELGIPTDRNKPIEQMAGGAGVRRAERDFLRCAREKRG